MENKKIDKGKLTLEQQAMVENLEALTKAGSSLQDIADALKGQGAGSKIEITDRRSQDIGPILEAVNKSILAIKGVKDLEPGAITGPVVDALKSLESVLSGKNFDVRPQVNVAPPKVEVSAPQVNVDLDKVAREVKGLKVNPLPAVSDEGGLIYINGKGYEPHHAKIDVTKAGVTVVVDGSVRVISCFLMSSDSTDIQWLSGGVEAISGFIPLSPSTGFVLPYNPAGWIRATDSLGIEQRGNAKMGGFLTYIED